mmetsp:Transcript_13704/g.27355  ORF Transcript_13704/g.27355 Transcript_13704/m.27355 type:complete len:124 (-) Transcript_13704:216-587(-)
MIGLFRPQYSCWTPTVTTGQRGNENVGFAGDETHSLTTHESNILHLICTIKPRSKTTKNNQNAVAAASRMLFFSVPRILVNLCGSLSHFRTISMEHFQSCGSCAINIFVVNTFQIQSQKFKNL